MERELILMEGDLILSLISWKILDEPSHLPEFPFTHNNLSTYFIGLFWGGSEIVCVKVFWN